MRWRAWCPGLVLVAAPAFAACPSEAADGRVLSAGPVQLAWRVEGEPTTIVIGQHFALRLQVCPAAARLARVDASMPEHRHGMNYRPTVQPLGDGLYRAEGLLFHMAGRWELLFDVEVDGRKQRLRDSMVLP